MVMIKVNDFEFNIQKIADSGQCFRMNKISDNTYSVIAYNHYVEVQQHDGFILLSCSLEEYNTIWNQYFDKPTDISYSSLVRYAEQDEFVKKAIEYSAGIRILNQDFFETLISFIISQRKSIPAIKTCIEKLCRKYGNAIEGKDINGNIICAYGFPSASVLKKISVEELKECGLGYRAEYVQLAALWWDEVARYWNWQMLLSDYNLCMKLFINDLKGVGIKVANCTCLFGLHQLNACPVDVWIQRVINEEYNGFEPAWISSDIAGLIQQYVFYYRRSSEKIRKDKIKC